MALDPVREAAAWEIARARRISAVPLPGGRWRSLTAAGEAIDLADHADPVEALEAAEAAIAAGEQRQAETRARRLFDALARGTYIPVPSLPDAEGAFVWRVRRVADNTVVAGPFPGLLGALLEIARLVDEPAAPEGAPLSAPASGGGGRR